MMLIMVKRTRQKKNRLVWRVGIIAAVIALLVLLFFPGRGLFYLRALQNQVDELESENECLQTENVHLEQEIKRLKTDEQYIEKLAREKYELLKKNEEVYEFKRSAQKK